MNIHAIDDINDANSFLARLDGIPARFTQLVDGLKLREEKGIILPKFLFDKVIESSQNIISGFPFDNRSDENPLYKSFKQKLDKLDKLAVTTKDSLLEVCTKSLVNKVQPAYSQFIAYLKELKTRADDRAGVWKFPEVFVFGSFQRIY